MMPANWSKPLPPFTSVGVSASERTSTRAPSGSAMPGGSKMAPLWTVAVKVIQARVCMKKASLQPGVRGRAAGCQWKPPEIWVRGPLRTLRTCLRRQVTQTYLSTGFRYGKPFQINKWLLFAWQLFPRGNCAFHGFSVPGFRNLVKK
jgi:hypothetical protein